ncbi:ABC transporter ATP-binding protein [Pedobacter frigoris]|uniref:ABC transporter ATP-binding protein n=1 Tax=Pedobacter frigoris TaxID=2571272 RepID=A0A4U1CQB8_9SPHI|nr:ABC transporter ATP-binding protein [Pedobacter frigoris]TKC09526.1 ABC transporter ATP-binding protein [Pedobacter frigoris]
MLKLLKPYSGLIITLLFLALAGNVLSLLLPKIIGSVIDGLKNPDFSMNNAMVQFSSITALVFIFGYLQSILQIYASEKVARDLRTSLSHKISIQNFSFIEQQNPAKLLTNLTSDVDAIKQFVSQAIVSMISSLVIIIGSTILLFSIDWELGLIVICIVSTIGITFYLVLKRVKMLYKKSREVIDRLNKVINESILGAFLVRVVNSQALEYDKFLEASVKGKNLGLAILRLFAWLIPIITFTANIAALVILIYGGHLVITTRMSIGDLAAFNSYLAMLIFPIIVIGFMSNVIVQATVSYGRISKVLDAEDLLDGGKIEADLTGAISVEQVNLSYAGKKVLKDISFEIQPGSKVAIVGPTVAGKTQLLQLMAGMVKPDDGLIKFNDFLISDIESNTFYRQLAIVFQDSVLFNMSIRDNIAFSEQITEEQLQLAIETAELKGLIDSLPNGVDTLISERGLSLSGGQKQRIMLARALAIRPNILLLDDFTARVDQQTEQRILENIQRNYPSITLISVTQKVAAVENYDKIILMMQGEILDSGKHKELMLRSPEYVQIYNSQQSTSNYEL